MEDKLKDKLAIIVQKIEYGDFDDIGQAEDKILSEVRKYLLGEVKGMRKLQKDITMFDTPEEISEANGFNQALKEVTDLIKSELK